MPDTRSIKTSTVLLIASALLMLSVSLLTEQFLLRGLALLSLPMLLLLWLKIKQRQRDYEALSRQFVDQQSALQASQSSESDMRDQLQGAYQLVQMLEEKLQQPDEAKNTADDLLFQLSPALLESHSDHLPTLASAWLLATQPQPETFAAKVTLTDVSRCISLLASSTQLLAQHLNCSADISFSDSHSPEPETLNSASCAALIAVTLLVLTAPRPGGASRSVRFVANQDAVELVAVTRYEMEPQLRQLLATLNWEYQLDSIVIPLQRSQDRPVSVLAVDDHAANLKLLSLLLEELGCDVVTASHGSDVLARLELHQIDVVILDLQLPGLSGEQVLQQVRQHYGQQHLIIALTAHLNPEQAIGLRDLGFDDCLEKPATTQKLADALGDFHVTATRKAPLKASRSRPEQHTGRQIYDLEASLALSNQNPDIADELLSLLIETLPEDIQMISQAWDQQNLPELRQKVHRLTGACRYCSVPRLTDAVVKLETAIKDQTKPDLSHLVEFLAAEARVICHWFEEDYLPRRAQAK